jgi:hypothetical protein
MAHGEQVEKLLHPPYIPMSDEDLADTSRKLQQLTRGTISGTVGALDAETDVRSLASNLFEDWLRRRPRWDLKKIERHS